MGVTGQNPLVSSCTASAWGGIFRGFKPGIPLSRSVPLSPYEVYPPVGCLNCVCNLCEYGLCASGCIYCGNNHVLWYYNSCEFESETDFAPGKAWHVWQFSWVAKFAKFSALGCQPNCTIWFIFQIVVIHILKPREFLLAIYSTPYVSIGRP